MNTTAATYRLFIGIPLPESYREVAERLRPLLADRLPETFRWGRPENCHLTLRFLGDTPADRVASLQILLGEVCFERFCLQAGGGGFFPNIHRPSVLWAGLIQGAQACGQLARHINAALQEGGWAGPDKPFVPHLSVGRMGRGMRRGGVSAGSGPKAKGPWENIARDLENVQWPEIPVDRFALWRSELGPGGPKYTVMAEFFASGTRSTGSHPG